MSYADFITLMFAVFVVMFASAQTDKTQTRRISKAVEAAFGGAKNPTKLDAAFQTLLSGLREEIGAGKMQVRMEERGLVVSLNETPFFPSGEDSISPSTYGAVVTVANAIRTLPNPIRAEGHSDAKPIHTPRFRDNWALSAARAIAVMEALRERGGISQRRLSVAGYADTSPVDTNETESGRARNRRVDIVIFSGSAPEPGPDRR